MSEIHPSQNALFCTIVYNATDMHRNGRVQGWEAGMFSSPIATATAGGSSESYVAKQPAAAAVALHNMTGRSAPTSLSIHWTGEVAAI